MYARARGRRCPDPRHWSEARGRRGHLALPGLPRQGGAARLHPGRGDRPRRPGQGSPQRTQLSNLDDPHRTRDLRGETLIVTSNYSPSQAARRCALEDPQAAFPLASRLALAGENHRGGRVRPPGGTPPAGGVCWAKELGEELRRRPAGCPLGRGKASPPRRKAGGLLAPRSGLRATEGGQDLPPSRDSRRDLPK